MNKIVCDVCGCDADTSPPSTAVAFSPSGDVTELGPSTDRYVDTVVVIGFQVARATVNGTSGAGASLCYEHWVAALRHVAERG